MCLHYVTCGFCVLNTVSYSHVFTIIRFELLTAVTM